MRKADSYPPHNRSWPESAQYALGYAPRILIMSKRVSLILSDSDEAQIGPYLDKVSPAVEVLSRWANEHDASGDIKSEAAALRALLQAGAEALKEHVLDVDYAQLATEFNTEPSSVGRRAARDDYARRTESRR